MKKKHERERKRRDDTRDIDCSDGKGGDVRD